MALSRFFIDPKFRCKIDRVKQVQLPYYMHRHSSLQNKHCVDPTLRERPLTVPANKTDFISSGENSHVSNTCLNIGLQNTQLPEHA